MSTPYAVGESPLALSYKASERDNARLRAEVTTLRRQVHDLLKSNRKLRAQLAPKKPTNDDEQREIIRTLTWVRHHYPEPPEMGEARLDAVTKEAWS